MLSSPLWLALAALGGGRAADTTGAAPISAYLGRARSLDSGRLLFTEHHFRYQRDGRRLGLVLYVCPNGKAFARKRIADGASPAPDFAFVDALAGYREGVRREGGRRVVYVQRDGASPERVKPLPDASHPVVDAGFDVFVHRHWRKLLEGSTVSLQFLIPSRQRFMRFRVREHGHAPPGKVRLRLRLDSWLAFALPHIDVTYDIDSRRLRSFSGLSNVRDARGKNVAVRVVFDGYRSNVDAHTLREAQTAALDGRCAMH